MFLTRNTFRLLTLLSGFCLFAVGVCAEIIAPLSKHSFNYQSFDYEESSLSLVGTAETLQDASIERPGAVRRLRLTDAVTGQVGATWYSEKLRVDQGFSTEFSFQMLAEEDSGGEGLAFIIQNDDAGATLEAGPSGTGSKDLVVAVLTSGDNPVLKVLSGGEDIKVVQLEGFQLTSVDSSSQPHVLRADFAGSQLSVWIDGQPVLEDLLLDLKSLGAVDDQGMAQVGIVASSGDIPQTHDITRWFFVPGRFKIAYPHFGGTAQDFHFIGDSRIQRDFPGTRFPGDFDFLTVNDNAKSKRGAAWLKEKYDLRAGFSIEFDLHFNHRVGASGADGMCFVIHNHADGLNLNPGEWGINQSGLTFAFGSYNNALLRIRGDGKNLVDIDLKEKSTVNGTFSKQGGDDLPYRLKINYAPNDLDIYFDGELVLDSLDLDFNSLNANDALGLSWLGFAGRTGGQSENHYVTRWYASAQEEIPEVPYIELVGVNKRNETLVPPTEDGQWTDPGFRLLAPSGAPLPIDNVTIAGDTVDVSTPGIYSITYNYAGNEGTAQEVIRLVLVPEKLDTILPVPSPALHFDAMDTDNDGLKDIFSDGAVLLEWKDKSGHGRDLTAFGGPTFHPKLLADEPGVALALEDRLLTDPISTQAIAGNDYNQTAVLAVLRFKGGEAGRVWMQWLGTGNTRIGLESDAIFDWGNMADNTRCRLAGWNVGQDSVRIVSAVKTPSAMTVHVDGSLAAQHGNPATLVSSSSRFSLGGQPTTTNHRSEIDLHEVLVYNRALSSYELNKLGYHLQGKWGIEGSYFPESADPRLKFEIGDLVYSEGMKFDLGAFSESDPPSDGAITYSLSRGPAALEGSTLTITGTGAITVSAVIAADGDYLEQSRSITFNVNPSSFAFENGFADAAADFNLVSAAKFTTDTNIAEPADISRLRLTDNTTSKMGSAWYRKKMLAEDGFATEFDVQFTHSLHSGADGMCFSLHNHASGPYLNVGERGPDSNSFSLLLDSYQNGGAWADPSAACLHLKVNNDFVKTISLPDFPAITAIQNNDLSNPGDAPPYRIRMEYAPGDLDLFFNDVHVLKDYDLRLSTDNALDANGYTWLGFGARTGGHAENHDVTRWSFTSRKVTVLAGGPVISEFQPAPGGSIQDEDGDSSAWLEIHNASAQPINLTGWTLTNARDNLSLWTLPGVTMEPDSLHLVHLSGKDRADPAANLHTNFILTNEAGGYLALAKPDGITIASEFELREIPEGTSFGTLGTEQTQGYFEAPTPGQANTAPQGLDPRLQFNLSKNFIAVGESLELLAVSTREPSSEGTVSYQLIAGPAVLEGATLTATGKGAIELRASIDSDGDYFADTANSTVLVSEPSPAPPNGMPVGLVLHYDAWDRDADGVVDIASDGANIHLWKDLSQNGNHATAPGRAPWVDNTSINGHPAVLFRPIDQSRLESPILTSNDLAGPKGDEMTLVMVATYYSGTVWTQWQDRTQRYSIEFNGRFDFPNALASQGQLTGWSIGDAGTPRIIVAMKTPTDQRIYLDGTLAVSRPNATSLEAGYSSAVAIGGQPGTTANASSIDMGEYLLFSRALNEGEHNLLGWHLQQKWDFSEGTYIDPATDPQLVFQVNGQVYREGLEIPMNAFSLAAPPSSGTINIKLDEGPGTLSEGNLIVDGPGEFKLTATVAEADPYIEQTRTITFQVFPSEFTYDGFEGAESDFSLIGTTVITQDTDLPQPPDAWRLRITDNQKSQLGSAWYKYKMPMEDGFDTEFHVHLAEAINTGADGMTFILHNHPDGSLLNTSERGPDTDAITLQIDSHKNGGAWADPSAAFLRLTLDGQTLAIANLPDFPDITTITGNDLSQTGTDAAPYKIRIIYEPGDFDVYFDDVLVIDSVNLTLNSSNVLDSKGLGWFGFSGRTGGAAENHDVTYWSFKNKTRRILLGGPVISEFMAENEDTIHDTDGDSSDWIEIHNASAGAVNLEGWHLSDDAGNLTQWTFPRVLLEPNQYLLVFASGKDRKVDPRSLHTNFQLGNASGGYLALTKPDGTTIVTEFKDYIRQKADISYGSLGEEQSINYFTNPTPGNPNAGPQGIPAGKVFFSVVGGMFTGSFQVELSPEFPEGTAIRFTTDGSVPTAESTLYTQPIEITTTTRIRARTFAEGWQAGPIEQETWLKAGDDVKTFSSNLPLVVLDSLGFNVNGDATRSRHHGYSVIVDVDTDTGQSSLLGDPDYAGNMGFNVRGQTSGSFPKKSYRLEVINDLGEDKSVSLLGMPSDDDWVLHSPYSDKTLMRNYLAYTWFEQMGHYSVRRKLVEVFVNQDGGDVSMADYKGVSVLVEYIKRDGDRVDIARLGPEELAAPNLEGGYLFKKDKGLDANTTFATATENQTLGFVYPSQPAGAQINYIKGYLDNMEQVLHGGNFADPTAGYARYMDVRSFIDVHLLVEMCKQIDGYRLSSYFHKDRGGKLVSGPVWDYNLSLGNADYNGGDNPEGWYADLVGANGYPWYKRLFADPEFVVAYWDRWFELRRGSFTDENLLDFIDATTTRLAEPQARNFQTWQVLGTRLWPNPTGWESRDTHQKEVDYMKDWLQLRTAWMDSQYGAPPGFSQHGGKVTEGFDLAITTSEEDAVIYFTTDGSDPRQRGGAVSASAKVHPTEKVTLPSAVSSVNSRTFKDGQWGALNKATFIIEGAIASATNLEVTEIHYHPLTATEAEAALGYSASDFEFIELHNKSETNIEMKGLTVEQGQPFDTLTLDSKLLAADGYGLLVRNRAAFKMRYPDVSDEAILAEWGSGRLSNGGESILITSADEQIVASFSFQDGDPEDETNLWPQEPDGLGPSLVPTGKGVDASDPTWWSASGKDGGSPGAPETIVVDPYVNWKTEHFTVEQLADSEISGDDADPDGDLLTNQAEFIAGTSPVDATSSFHATNASFSGQDFIITLATVSGKSYRIEKSADLTNWEEVPDSTFTATKDEESVRLSPSFSGRGFYRVVVE